MEASHSNPDGTKEGPLYDHPTYWPFSGPFTMLFFPLPANGPFVSRLHPFSYWLTHLYLFHSLLLHLGPLLGTMHFALKTETARFSKTLVSNCNTTWYHNP
jgi:hypothetical protein